jgi:CheY-like chemotaxis protein
MSTSPGKAKTTEPATRHYLSRMRTARQPTILVVEDHDHTREMLHLLLETWGCRVVEACNGLEAVEAAAHERPEMILMDGSLPFVDGLEATRRMQTTRPTFVMKKIPGLLKTRDPFTPAMVLLTKSRRDSHAAWLR